MRAAPAILVVTGAAGAGKTTLVGRLAALGLPGVGCYHFDAIGIPSGAEMAARFGSGEALQAWALGEWIVRLARNEDGVWVAVVLVDCAYAERNERLRGPRGQPELATPRMDGWAAYLRGQADALDLPVLDTTATSPDEGVATLRTHLAALLEPTARPDAAPQPGSGVGWMPNAPRR